MKSKELINQIRKLSTPTIAVRRKEFGKRISEYCRLYKSVYSSAKNPDCKIRTFESSGSEVYVDRLEYIDFLKDLGLLRYKFSRKKYKVGNKNEKRA